MVAYPITAWAAHNAAGTDAAAIVDAIVTGQPRARAVTRRDETTVPVTARVEALTAPLAARGDAARARWGASRVSAIVALSTGGGPGDGPIVDELAAWLHVGLGAQGPGYVLWRDGAAGAAAVAGALRLLDAGVADAVIAGGLSLGDSASVVGAVVLVERQGEAAVELTEVTDDDPAAGWRSDLAYVDVAAPGDEAADLAVVRISTAGGAGDLGAAAGVTELVVGAECLRRDRRPVASASPRSLDHDHILVTGAGHRLLLAARLS